MSRVALILSAGRTGTKFLASYLNENYSEIVARHEPAPSSWLLIASHAHMQGLLSRGALVRLLARKRRLAIDPIDTEIYVESNPYIAGFVDVIDEVFENPVIIHIVRDPRDYVRSSLNHGTSTGLKGLANRFLPFWFPNVRRILDLPDDPSWLGRVAGLWTLVDRILDEGGERASNYHRIHYEDLFDPKRTGLRAVCAAIGVEYRAENLRVEADERINRGRLSILPDWRERSTDQCLELKRICGALMPRYKYGLETEWKERVDRDG